MSYQSIFLFAFSYISSKLFRYSPLSNSACTCSAASHKLHTQVPRACVISKSICERFCRTWGNKHKGTLCLLCCESDWHNASPYVLVCQCIFDSEFMQARWSIDWLAPNVVDTASRSTRSGQCHESPIGMINSLSKKLTLAVINNCVQSALVTSHPQSPTIDWRWSLVIIDNLEYYIGSYSKH